MGDQVTTLIVALFGGAIAALIGGYFARPKTKGEAAQANANATVSLSADAREWAQLWMTKAGEAEEKARTAEEKADDAEKRCDDAELRLDGLDSKLAAAVVYMRQLRMEINRLDGHVPMPPAVLKGMWDEDDRKHRPHTP